MNLYTLRKTSEGWRCVKFDENYNVEGQYEITVKEDGEPACSCPQSLRGPCRHLEILDAFEVYERVDKGWFYNFETQDWYPPIETESTINPPKEVDANVPQFFPGKLESVPAELVQPDWLFPSSPEPSSDSGETIGEVEASSGKSPSVSGRSIQQGQPMEFIGEFKRRV